MRKGRKNGRATVRRILFLNRNLLSRPVFWFFFKLSWTRFRTVKDRICRRMEVQKVVGGGDGDTGVRSASPARRQQSRWARLAQAVGENKKRKRKGTETEEREEEEKKKRERKKETKKKWNERNREEEPRWNQVQRATSRGCCCCCFILLASRYFVAPMYHLGGATTTTETVVVSVKRPWSCFLRSSNFSKTGENSAKRSDQIR